MAHRKIREYDAKRLITTNIAKYAKNQLIIPFQTILISPETNIDQLPQHYPWLLTQQLVAKPDQLFGKRKQYNLVLLNANWQETKEWLIQHKNKEVTIGKSTDKLTHFIIEPFIPHQEEYYLSITSSRNHDTINFSTQGGFNIEERWDTVQTINIPILESISEETIHQHLTHIPQEKKTILTQFIIYLYQLYVELNFVTLEINPFTIINNKTNNNSQQTSLPQIILLDLVAQIDDCAHFKNKAVWGNLEFPTPFGQKTSSEEEHIKKLNENSGASLNLTILNPNGRIWNILSGGGASVICLDSLVNSGLEKEIANYGEYSGNPTTQETYEYTKTIFSIMTKQPHPKGKILIIAGAIANFTDIKKTFEGICLALTEYQESLRNQNISIYVRRGGPNDQQGLKLIKETCNNLNIPIEVYGPETAMTNFIPRVAKKLKEE